MIRVPRRHGQRHIRLAKSGVGLQRISGSSGGCDHRLLLLLLLLLLLRLSNAGCYPSRVGTDGAGGYYGGVGHVVVMRLLKTVLRMRMMRKKRGRRQDERRY